jgi:drug/metabolite transporter (DMT)-like permease
MGIKKIGGVQTALLGLSEIFITIIVSYFLLDEVLTAHPMGGRCNFGEQP